MRLFDNGERESSSLSSKTLGKLSMIEYDKAVMGQRIAWAKLVDRYTNRKLTKQTDILPGISGIAQAVAKATSDEYCAGLWRSYFPQCLLWVSDFGDGTASHSRSLRYLAPTWSWASVKGHVKMPQLDAWHNYNAKSDPSFLPTMLNISLDVTGTEPYGMLKGGSLTISGKTRPAVIKSEDLGTVYSSGKDKIEKVGWFCPDIKLCLECNPPGKIRFIFIICCWDDKPLSDGGIRTCGLGLEADGMQDLLMNRYRRLGVVTVIYPEFWDKARIMDVNDNTKQIARENLSAV